VVAPFVLTSELVALLSTSAPSRVITVSSGGMYTQRYDLDQLEMGPDTYDGVTAYARSKRAQVVLSREWARRRTGCGIVFHAMHPGWADTPGVQTALPAFRGVMRPLLRNADQGSDTIVWLAASTEAARCSGRFWHDRRPRWEHKVPWTRPAGSALEGDQLWDWCTRRAARSTWPDTSW
jgi:dehydrogenase/reductase SDR family protein 12